MDVCVYTTVSNSLKPQYIRTQSIWKYNAAAETPFIFVIDVGITGIELQKNKRIKETVMATVKEDRLTETVNVVNIIYIIYYIIGNRHVYFINVTAIILVRLMSGKRVLLLRTLITTILLQKKKNASS